MPDEKLYFFAMLITPETQLAYLGFQLVAPALSLRPYVRSYWLLRRDTPLLAAREEYMHGQGAFGIVFNLGDSVRLNGQTVTDPVFLDSANSVSRVMNFMGQVDLVGIRFHTGGAYPFLALPLAELRDSTVLLDGVDRTVLLRLHQQLGETPAVAARVALLEGWLLDRLVLGKTRDGLIPASLALLREHQGQMTIPEVAAQFAISQRHLERLYQTQVGISPRQYVGLLRVERARLALKHIPPESTTRLAVDLGFYDQSHFIREFSAVVGMTPYRYMRRHLTPTPASPLRDERGF